MSRLFLRISSMPIFAAAIFFMSGCEEDARFAARTQYLGGIYGTAPTAGAPHDTVSYWDGDGIGGKPAIKISLGEQRAYFYKSGMLVGISQLSTGAKGLTLRRAISPLSRRTSN